MKDGEPCDLFSSCEGVSGPLPWLREHALEAQEIARELGQKCYAFPAWEKPRGSKGRISLSTGWARGAASKEDIRAAQQEVAAMPPYCMPLEAWGKKAGGLNLTGHSQHGSEPDWAKKVGPWPTALPYARRLPADLQPPRGFLKEERRALGHWLREQNGEMPSASECAEVLRKRRERGEAGTGIPSGSPARQDMEDRYAAGEGRVGERAEQLRLRRRMALYARAAVEHWCAYHRVPWWRLPKGRADLDILEMPPERVPPCPA
jgi:hypothetical protein